MVRTSPCTKLSDGLRMKADPLAADFLQFEIPEDNFRGVDGRRENTELGLGSSHLKGGSAAGAGDRGLDQLGSLGDDEIGATSNAAER